MGIIETEGIVTREVKYGDNGRIITLITKDLGKISVLASRSRLGKSGLLVASQLFCYAGYTLFKSGEKSLYKINEASVIESFQPLRESLDRMAYASYFCEVAQMIVQENNPEPNQLSLLLNTLYLLCKTETDFPRLKGVYELRTLLIGGAAPDLLTCAGCGEGENVTALSIREGVGYCPACQTAHKDVIALNRAVRTAILYILHADAKKIFSFQLSPDATRYLSILGERLLTQFLGKEPPTLSYLRQITDLGT